MPPAPLSDPSASKAVNGSANKPPKNPRHPNWFGWSIISLRNLLVGFSVQFILFLLWLGMLGSLFIGLFLPTLGKFPTFLKVLANKFSTTAAPDPQADILLTQVAIAGAVIALCLLPKLLTFCIAMLIQQRSIEKTRYRLEPRQTAHSVEWDACFERVNTQWDQEMQRAQEGVTRLVQYAGIYGFVCSAALTCCALFIFSAHGDANACGTAVAVSSAVAVSFGVNLGRIVVRAANRDSSARMFAWACRGQLLVIASAVLLVALTRQGADAAATKQSYVIIGATVALFGERALQSIADRAAKVLNLPTMGVQTSAELAQINGLSEEDVNRLAEEGIVTIHALAFTSTPRLHFHTPYTLQRICDWQDQALLLTVAGTKAQLFREQLMVRGAMDAQMLAEELLRLFDEQEFPATQEIKLNRDREGAAGGNAFMRTLSSLKKGELEDLVKMLGFGTVPQARVALTTLVEDEVIRRLRIYQRCSVKRFVSNEFPPVATEADTSATEVLPNHVSP